MVLFITYVLHCFNRKKKKERKTRPWSLHNHQTKCCLQGWLIPLAFWPYQFCVWPWKAQCYNLSTTFFNKRKFRQIKTSLKNHHRSRYWQENKLFLGYPHQSKIKFKSSKCTEMKEKNGRGWSTGSCHAHQSLKKKMVEGTPTTTTTTKHTNM